MRAYINKYSHGRTLGYKDTVIVLARYLLHSQSSPPLKHVIIPSMASIRIFNTDTLLTIQQFMITGVYQNRGGNNNTMIDWLWTGVRIHPVITVTKKDECTPVKIEVIMPDGDMSVSIQTCIRITAIDALRKWLLNVSNAYTCRLPVTVYIWERLHEIWNTLLEHFTFKLCLVAGVTRTTIMLT
jgi:hypothetical protein